VQASTPTESAVKQNLALSGGITIFTEAQTRRVRVPGEGQG
jgi:hypothetical protein